MRASESYLDINQEDPKVGAVHMGRKDILRLETIELVLYMKWQLHHVSPPNKQFSETRLAP